LPTSVQMRHDLHYVEELARPNRPVGKILPIDKIEPNPEQPRTEIGDLSELTESIKQNGVLEPLLVKPNRDRQSWMIIAGERRWRASNLAGLREVPCIELDLDEKSIAEIALIENLQRKDLTIWEEADGLKALKDKFGYTQEEIAKKISKSRTTVTESLTIAGLPESIREKCRESNITAKSTLLEIARQFDEKAMHSFLSKIGSNGANREKVRQTARPEKNLEQTNSSEKISNKTFRYVSENKDFNLEIRFSNLDNFQKRDVLKALKEAFEKTKNAEARTK
jgi:ParB family transcriptional regulator, chromosome partitioning protein